MVSVTKFITDGTRNVIPGTATIKGDTRSYKPEVQALLERRMAALCSGICAAHGAGLAFEYSHEFEPTVNPPQCLDAVVRAAVEVAGEDRVDGDCRPVMGSEDFGVFLKHIPGNYIQLGAGVDALPLHNSGFDFNDSLLVPGARYLRDPGPAQAPGVIWTEPCLPACGQGRSPRRTRTWSGRWPSRPAWSPNQWRRTGW